MTKLIEKEGSLYLNENSILVTRIHGDAYLAKWPLKDAKARHVLAVCLYDEYECGFLQERSVILPDGSLFEIDSNMDDSLFKDNSQW